MENAQERIGSLNETMKIFTESALKPFEQIDPDVLMLQAKELSKAFKILTESVSKNFSNLPTSGLVDALRQIDEMYQRDILPAILRIQDPENFEPSPISEECMEKLSDIAAALPEDAKEKTKLTEMLKNKKWSLKSILGIIVDLIAIFTFIQQEIYPQKEETTNIYINNVNIIEINSQNEDVISESDRELFEKILEAISELLENIDDDVVSSGAVDPDQTDSVENDMDE